MVFLHLLGHRDRFELFDYTYHVLRVLEASPVEAIDDQEVQRFLSCAQYTAQINRNILNCLGNIKNTISRDAIVYSEQCDHVLAVIHPLHETELGALSPVQAEGRKSKY